ncbi:MAG TPA: lipoyl(octanoyl) transferase LipB [Phycisphaerae bacterium]|nr:lipoyl(octanoyl) transferase LipB [Phycisphaerae bacterium]
MKTLITEDLGQISYAEALEKQLRLVAGLIENDNEPERLLLLEHVPAVITAGRRGREEDFLVPRERLTELGIELHESSRGGQLTYHGPGQLVGYLIRKLDSHNNTVHDHVWRLEESVIRLLAELGIAADRKKWFTGVWVGEEKITAIGVAVKRWVTYHGFALNVNTDLDCFKLFVPCGIRDKGVTSIQKILSRQMDMADIKKRLDICLRSVYGY